MPPWPWGSAPQKTPWGGQPFPAGDEPLLRLYRPVFAGVGYTEERAKELGIAARRAIFPPAATPQPHRRPHGRHDQDPGRRALRRDPGRPILAPNASELIQEAALAIGWRPPYRSWPTPSTAIPPGRGAAGMRLAVEKRAIHIPNR